MLKTLITWNFLKSDGSFTNSKKLSKTKSLSMNTLANCKQKESHAKRRGTSRKYLNFWCTSGRINASEGNTLTGSMANWKEAQTK